VASWVEVHQRIADEQWVWECTACGARARSYDNPTSARTDADQHQAECPELNEED
jgi:hypothetical protein